MSEDREWSPRHQKMLGTLLRVYGVEAVKQQIDRRSLEDAPKRGRPPDETLTDISVTKTPWEGVFCVRLSWSGQRFRTASDSIVAFVRPRELRAGPKTGVEENEKHGFLPTPNRLAASLAETIFAAHEREGAFPSDLESIKRTLIRKFQEAGLP